MFEVLHYQTKDGRYPFREWIRELRDPIGRIRIAARLDQLEAGNIGDSKSVGEGVVELRIHIGPGYRVYCGRYGTEWIVLLCGGNKSSQISDIRHAKDYWSNWKARQG